MLVPVRELFVDGPCVCSHNQGTKYSQPCKLGNLMHVRFAETSRNTFWHSLLQQGSRYHHTKGGHTALVTREQCNIFS